MKAVLHVPVSRDFDFPKYIDETLSSFSDSYHINSRKNRVKAIKNDDGSVTVKGTSRGEPWTWVTAHGNAIHVWDTINIKHKRIVAIELDSRRHAVRNFDNGVGLLISRLEYLSGLQRENWDIIYVESTADAPWYEFGVRSRDDG